MPAGLLLTFAIVAEVVGTVALNLADGCACGRSPVPASDAFLRLPRPGAQATRRRARLMRSGLVLTGTAAVAVIAAAFGEPMDAVKALSILAVMAGVIGLNLSSAHRASRRRPAPRDPRGHAPGNRPRGLAAVDHRTVAAEAGVPLGSTTYYFSSKDDMASQTLNHVADQEAERLAAARLSLEGAEAAEVPERLIDIPLLV
ncbi:MAG: hypothetical protein WKF31_13250 [Thermoleophilaceae bacterium]